MSVLTPCRDAETGEIPTSASRLARYATEAGWHCRVTYAKAQLEEKVIESIVVRLRRPPLAAVGAWHNGKFAVGYVGTAFTSPKKTSARDLSKFVKGVQA